MCGEEGDGNGEVMEERATLIARAMHSLTQMYMQSNARNATVSYHTRILYIVIKP